MTRSWLSSMASNPLKTAGLRTTSLHSEKQRGRPSPLCWQQAMVSAFVCIKLQYQKSSVVAGTISMIKNAHAKSPFLFEWFLFFASLLTPDHQEQDFSSHSDTWFPTFPAFPCPSTLRVLKDFSNCNNRLSRDMGDAEERWSSFSSC